MELDSGLYYIEVLAKGHKTEKRWIKLSAGEDRKIKIRLMKIVEANTLIANEKLKE